eukprot:CRZ02777.1 hypothetical protein [Spongospora subterranea]
MDLNMSTTGLLRDLISPRTGVLFYIIFDIHIPPKYRISSDIVPTSLRKLLNKNPIDPNLLFFPNHAYTKDSFEVNIFEYFFIGVAKWYGRLSLLRAKISKQPDASNASTQKLETGFKVEFLEQLYSVMIHHSVPAMSSDGRFDLRVVADFQMERARELISIVSDWWFSSYTYDHSDSEFVVPSDCVFQCGILLVDSLLMYSSPFELIDLFRVPLFRFLFAALSRYPLARIDEMMHLPADLWLHWIMPWRACDLPVSPWDSYIQSQLPFYSVLLTEFLESAMHIKLVNSDAIAPVDRVIQQFVNPELISILGSCESKLGLLYSHASVDWRRFQQLSINSPSEYIPFRDHSTRTHHAALQLWSALMVADSVTQSSILESAIETLKLLFDIQTDSPAVNHVNVTALKRLQVPVGSLPDPSIFSDGHLLSQFEKAQLRKGIAVCSKLDVPFIGDEWEMLIRSQESTILVSIAHGLSKIIRRFIVPVNIRWMTSPFIFFQMLIGFFVAWLLSKTLF